MGDPWDRSDMGGEQGEGVTERCKNRGRVRGGRREVTQGQDLGVTKQEI